jgi:hypothetical protein
MNSLRSITGLAGSFLIAMLLFFVGCTDLPMDRPQLTRLGAAQRAAKLANDECEREYHERPFLPEQHAVTIENERYRWGEDDPNVLSGTFALVTFDLDGGCPQVILYHHTVQY